MVTGVELNIGNCYCDIGEAFPKVKDLKSHETLGMTVISYAVLFICDLLFISLIQYLLGPGFGSRGS